MVFDTTGTNYGHTILWDDLGNAPIMVGQPFQLVGFAGNSVSKVVNVTPLDVTVITKTSNFKKPVIYVRTAGGGSIQTPPVGGGFVLRNRCNPVFRWIYRHVRYGLFPNSS